MDQLVWAHDESSKKDFFDGYASIRRVPDLEKLLPLLRVSKALGAIGFTIRNGTWQARDKEIFERNYMFVKTFFNTI